MFGGEVVQPPHFQTNNHNYKKQSQIKMFKIINDETTIKTFREYYQTFQIHSSFNQIKTDLVVGLDELKPHIVQTNIHKNQRNYIHFNRFRDGYKSKDFGLLPHTFLLDIDGKSKKQRDNFCKDMGCIDYQQSLKKCYNLLKNDKCCLYIDYSQSNNGLHCLFTIISNYFTENDNVDINDSSIIDVLMKHNFNTMLEYLKPYNINFYNDKNNDYVDSSLTKITTGVYSSNGLGFYLNPLSNIIYYELNDNDLKINKPTTIIDVEKVKELNNNYSYKLFNYVLKIKDEKDLKDRFISDLKPLFSHYDERLLFSIKYVDTQYKRFYYRVYSNFYDGSSLKKHLRSFETFEKYLNNLKPKFIIPINSILDVDLTDRNSIKVDFFNNEYNETLYYNQFISENKTQLFNIFDSRDYVVLKSNSGSGKSSLIFDYINYCFSTMNTIVLCSPKNSLLTQQLTILTKTYPNIKIVENYGNSRVNMSLIRDEKVLILTSTPKIKYIGSYDLIIIDEIQNLINYSNKIVSNVDKRLKTILISSTTEPYLIFESGYYYVNLVKNNDIKKTLNVIVSRNFKKTLLDLVKSDEKTLIFYNNIDVSKDVEKTLKIKFKYLNSKNKDSHNLKCIKNQKLYETHYFSTSYISDGINFNNDSWDKLIIVDNGLSPFEIYQITYRFRLTNPTIYLITKGKSLYYKGFSGFEKSFFDGFRNMDYFNKMVNELQKDTELLNQNPTINKNIQKIENDFILKDLDSKYILNIDSIKKDVYDRFFNTFFSVYKNVWEYSLQYYFKVVKTFELDENESLKGFEKDSMLIDIFKENHKDLLMWSFGDWFDYHIDFLKLNNPTNKPLNVNDMVKDNITYFKNLLKRCKDLNDLGFDYETYLSEICGKQQNYQRFINRKRIESIDMGKNNDGLSLEYYKRQNKMVELIENSGIIKQHPKKSFEYFTINDLLEYLNNNQTLYSQFYFGKKYDFSLNSRDLGRYVSLIKRCFDKKEILLNGKNYRVFVVKNS